MGEVTRRTMLVGAAWTVPVVAVTAAAPAAAASGGGVPLLYWDRASVSDGEQAQALVRIPAGLPAGRATLQVSPDVIGEWLIRPVESVWVPDITLAYRYQAWRFDDPAPGLYSFQIEFTRAVQDARPVVFTPRLYIETDLIATGATIAAA
ncbi:hypothetical protein [Herbiconiux sp. A18JL235]|uniref:Uncharacterized protein n=1 Tax=Herbiconiux sp. A18JL235 TaxID=3152363 RepID=A0AB39BCS1_9MICO